MNKKLHVKTGDTVIVLNGAGKKDKNGNYRTAKVLEVSPEEGKVIVEGIKPATKHVKAKKQGDQSGIIKVDAPMYACKVQLYCNNCKKGVRSKSSIIDGKKIRVCAKCGKEI